MNKAEKELNEMAKSIKLTAVPIDENTKWGSFGQLLDLMLPDQRDYERPFSD